MMMQVGIVALRYFEWVTSRQYGIIRWCTSAWEPLAQSIGVGIRGGLSHEHRLQASPVDQLRVELHRSEWIIAVTAIDDIACQTRCSLA